MILKHELIFKIKQCFEDHRNYWNYQITVLFGLLEVSMKADGWQPSE